MERYDALIVGAGFGGLGAALTLAERGVRVVVCEALRYAARGAIDRFALDPSPSLNEQRDVLRGAAARLSEATAIDSRNAQAWSDRAYVTALWARVSPREAASLGTESEAFAREALQHSSIVPEFWVRLGVSLDLQGRWGEGNTAFSRAIRLAPNSSTMWYYQAYHLSLTPATRPLALAAVNEAIRLDPGQALAIKLQQSLRSSQ